MANKEPDKASVKSDKQLMREVREGSHSAFNVLFRRYHEKLYYFSMRYLNTKEDAEGVVQEIFLKVWLHRAHLDDTKSFNAFLHTMARNTIFNMHRKEQYDKVYRNYAKYLLDYVHTRSHDDVVYADLVRYLEEVLDQLPPQRRRVYDMSRRQGMSYKEIADELNLSEKTVETHIRLSLKTIREALSKILVFLVFYVSFHALI